MKKAILLALCVAVVLSFLSCQKHGDTQETIDTWCETYDAEVINSDPDNISYDYFFANVEELRLAIKKDPDKYNGTKIKVVGTIYKRDTVTGLVDLLVDSQNVGTVKDAESGAMGRAEFRKMLNSAEWKIDIIISNDAQYAVAESGDLVKLYGTINITRDIISINNCEYKLIASLDERVQK